MQLELLFISRIKLYTEISDRYSNMDIICDLCYLFIVMQEL